MRARVGKVHSLLKIVHDQNEANDDTTGGSVLDKIVRDSARQMLATALEAKVAAYVEQYADHVDENETSAGLQQRLPPAPGGHHRCGCGAGADTRVNDKRVGDAEQRKRFASAIWYRWPELAPLSKPANSTNALTTTINKEVISRQHDTHPSTPDYPSVNLNDARRRATSNLSCPAAITCATSGKGPSMPWTGFRGGPRSAGLCGGR